MALKMDDYIYQYYFWLLIFAIVLFIAFIIVVETSDNFHTTGSLEWWVWLIFAFAVTFLFVAMVLYYLQTPNGVVYNTAPTCLTLPSCSMPVIPVVQPIVETIVEPVFMPMRSQRNIIY